MATSKILSVSVQNIIDKLDSIPLYSSLVERSDKELESAPATISFSSNHFADQFSTTITISTQIVPQAEVLPNPYNSLILYRSSISVEDEAGQYRIGDIAKLIESKFLKAGWPPLPPSSFLETSEESLTNTPQLRVIQFNVLADALSTPDPEKGGFEFSPPECLRWETRSWRLLHAMLRCNPDVISIQECDQYVEFFAPYLGLCGYSSVYSPKPVPTRPDTFPHGNAIFYKSNKLTLRDATSHVLCVENSNGSSSTSSSSIVDINTINPATLTRPSNSNVVFAHFEMQKESKTEMAETSDSTQHFLFAATHLKSTKTYDGELCRLQQSAFLHNLLQKYYHSIATFESVNDAKSESRTNTNVHVVVCGDLNATVRPSMDIQYPSMVYPGMQGVSLVESSSSCFSNTADTSRFFRAEIDLRSVYRVYPWLIKKDFSRVASILRMQRECYDRMLRHFCSFVPTSLHPAPSAFLLPENADNTENVATRNTQEEQELSELPECPFSSFKTRKRGILCHTIDVILASKGLLVTGLLSSIDMKDLPFYGAPCFEWPSDHFVIGAILCLGEQ